MNEPKHVGAMVRASYPNSSHEEVWLRYSVLLSYPWINERGVSTDWASLQCPRIPESEEANLNVYFQMGLACGDLMRQGEKAMPIEMIYRLMSGEKWEDLQ